MFSCQITLFSVTSFLQCFSRQFFLISTSIFFFFFRIPACFADEELPLDHDGAEILSETFSILSLKEMKLQAGSSAAAGGAAAEDGDEDGGIATLTKKVLQAAQKKLVQQVGGSGRGLLTGGGPAAHISFRWWSTGPQEGIHRAHGSSHHQPEEPAGAEALARPQGTHDLPAGGSLPSEPTEKVKQLPGISSSDGASLTPHYQVVMQDYKNEVKVVFSSDEQLAAEVEFILKLAEKQQELGEQMVNCSLAVQNKTTAAAEVSSFYEDEEGAYYIRQCQRKGGRLY